MPHDDCARAFEGGADRGLDERTDIVDCNSLESFPASDAPGWIPLRVGGPRAPSSGARPAVGLIEVIPRREGDDIMSERS